MASILVIDEHSVFRRGLRAVIEARLQFRVSEASSLEGLADASFDLILLDAGILNNHTIEVLAEMHKLRPTMRVAVMSTSRARADVLNCLSAGFHGFIEKHQFDEALLGAISDLLSGRIYVPQWLADDAYQRPEVQLSINIGQEKLKLTRRQAEVLPLLALGMSNKEIARKLNIAEGTIKIHMAAVLRALGARNRTEAAFFAQRIIGSSERAASLSHYKRFAIGKLDDTSIRWSSGTSEFELP